VGDEEPDGEQFGKPRVREVLERHHDEPAEAISEHRRAALEAFRGGELRDDDVTYMIVRVTAA